MVSGSLINPGNEKNSTQKNVNNKMNNSTNKPSREIFSDWFQRLNVWGKFGFVAVCSLVCCLVIFLVGIVLCEFICPRKKHKKNNKTAEKVESDKQQKFLVDTTVKGSNNSRNY